jgi:beta-barrel assembly-enhancing protease
MTSKLQVLALGLLASAHLGCSATGRAKAQTTLAEVLISDEQEEQLGRQVREQLAKDGVKYLDDAQVLAYVQSLGNRLFPHAARDRRGVNWRIDVIDDPKTVNAFATPGGYLYVYTGLLIAADTEAEIAGVLGHEVGHVVGRHSARQLVSAYGLQSVLSLALGQNPSLLKKVAGNLAAQGLLLAYSRVEESEADETGARYSALASYDPRGLVTFFGKLRAKEGKVPGALTLLSSHPATADRIKHIEAYIAANKLGGSDLGADRLAPIKQRLAARSAAR